MLLRSAHGMSNKVCFCRPHWVFDLKSLIRHAVYKTQICVMMLNYLINKKIIKYKMLAKIQLIMSYNGKIVPEVGPNSTQVPKYNLLK